MTPDPARRAMHARLNKALEVVDALEAQCRRIRRPFEAEMKAATCHLDRPLATANALVEDILGDRFVVSTCEECEEPILDDEPSHDDEDISLCVDCAPSWEDLLRHPEAYIDFETGEAMTADRAQELADTHVAAGGELTDKVVA